MRSGRIGEPWKSFLADVDKHISTPLVLHCLGDFAVNLMYGLPRPTADIDVCEIAPGSAKAEVVSLAGKRSLLCKKHGVYLQIVTIASVPHNYEERLTEPFKGAFQNLHVLVLEPHDLALSKLGRNSDVDIEDVKYLALAVPLDLDRLRSRYVEEVRPYLFGPPDRGDLTLNLWCDVINELRATNPPSR